MIKVLFLCIHNSARSQMAEAYLKKFGGDKFLVESAGLEAGKLNFIATEVMKEDGIDISGNKTNDVFDYFKEGRIYRYVITVCDEASAAACPIFPGVHEKINWSFEDPSAFTGTYEEKLVKTREVRDKIKAAVLNFIKTNQAEMKKYAAEFIGTFALVFCGTGSIIINEQTNGSVGHIGVAITFGAIVLAMIYTFGDVSGAHLNPAVTIGFWVAQRFNKKEVIPYISSQVAGAFLATGILKFLFPDSHNLGATVPSGSLIQSFILELILTYFLMLVIINVSQGAKETGIMAGIAIGSTVMLEAMFAGPICGASMNPARSISPSIISGNYQSLWIYILAPVMGAIFATLTWRVMNKGN